MEPYFILALFGHGYKARTSTLYHLLKGKRTTSVLLYGFLYDNLRFFQLTPELTERQFSKTLTQLFKQKLLQSDGESAAQITDLGLQMLKRASYCYENLDNYRFGKTDADMWRLLQFSVQVVSHLSYSDKNYIPLEQSPLYQQQVKSLIKALPKAQLIKTVKQEWQQLFSFLSKESANFFAQQFSGYHTIGKTTAQLLDPKLEAFERSLAAKEALHQLLSLILSLEENSLLQKFILPHMKLNENQSMNETSQYLKYNLSLDELAKRRNLKKSTVQDHLLELALVNDFPFDQYLSEESIRFLGNLEPPYQDWVYRVEKQQQPQLDYFEFRLYQIKKLKEEREADK